MLSFHQVVFQTVLEYDPDSYYGVIVSCRELYEIWRKVLYRRFMRHAFSSRTELLKNVSLSQLSVMHGSPIMEEYDDANWNIMNAYDILSLNDARMLCIRKCQDLENIDNLLEFSLFVGLFAIVSSDHKICFNQLVNLVYKNMDWADVIFQFELQKHIIHELCIFFLMAGSQLNISGPDLEIQYKCLHIIKVLHQTDFIRFLSADEEHCLTVGNLYLKHHVLEPDIKKQIYAHHSGIFLNRIRKITSSELFEFRLTRHGSPRTLYMQLQILLALRPEKITNKMIKGITDVMSFILVKCLIELDLQNTGIYSQLLTDVVDHLVHRDDGSDGALGCFLAFGDFGPEVVIKYRESLTILGHRLDVNVSSPSWAPVLNVLTLVCPDAMMKQIDTCTEMLPMFMALSKTMDCVMYKMLPSILYKMIHNMDRLLGEVHNSRILLSMMLYKTIRRIPPPETDIQDLTHELLRKIAETQHDEYSHDYLADVLGISCISFTHQEIFDMGYDPDYRLEEGHNQ